MVNFSLSRLLKASAPSLCAITLASCVDQNSINGGGSSSARTSEATILRDREIATEATGDFYYARRYFVKKTRFWGYLRKPRQPWSEAKLVMMNESSMLQPDRLHENGPWNARHGYDNNYEYRITGSYTGRKIYEPSSNLFLPEFRATGYTRISTKPGFLFNPNESYNPNRVTLVNKNVKRTR